MSKHITLQEPSHLIGHTTLLIRLLKILYTSDLISKASDFLSEGTGLHNLALQYIQ